MILCLQGYWYTYRYIIYNGNKQCNNQTVKRTLHIQNKYCIAGIVRGPMFCGSLNCTVKLQYKSEKKPAFRRFLFPQEFRRNIVFLNTAKPAQRKSSVPLFLRRNSEGLLHSDYSSAEALSSAFLPRHHYSQPCSACFPLNSSCSAVSCV